MVGRDKEIQSLHCVLFEELGTHYYRHISLTYTRKTGIINS
jgi:hypothetical protein